MRKKRAKQPRIDFKQFDRRAVKSILAGQDSNMSQLARALGISAAYMHDLLKGHRPTNGYISEVAKHLGVPETSITMPDPEKE
jgi:transcriptional regulator with XRE-family HTH domain